MSIVFNVFDRIFGVAQSPTEWLLSNPTFEALREGGFSQEEAAELAFFYARRRYGRQYGVVAGVAVGYCITPWIKILSKHSPLFGASKPAQLAFRVAAGLLTYDAVDYFFTGPRIGANNGLSELFLSNNNQYTLTKQAFVRNFEVLNRPFTEEERKRFSANQKTKNSAFERRFIYNPALHGDDEEAFKKQIEQEFIQKIAPWETREVQQQIAIDNQAKIEAGLNVRVKPYNPLDDFDQTGLKLGLKKHTFFKPNYVLG